MMKKIAEKLAQVQAKLAVPKERENTFGGFSYRSAEDILRAVKPLLAEHNLLLTLNDSIIMLGNRFYVVSTARLTDTETGEGMIVQAQAREPESRTKMDDAQVTGSSSSYARKYALCGLFAIDDSSTDPDARDNTNGITQSTREKLAAVAKAKNITPQNMTAIMLSEFKVERSANLTEEQGRALLKILNEMAVN
ncbi:ERF family protein [Negativicoccus succinicivorans]